MRKFLLTAAVLALSTPALAAVQSQNCRGDNIAFIGAETSSVTTSQNWTDLPETTIEFRTIGAVADCILVSFEGGTVAYGNTRLFVRALLDGKLGFPRALGLSGDDDEDNDLRSPRTHGFTFFFTNVPPGKHSVKIQWRTEFEGMPVRVHNRTTKVHFKGD